MSTLYYLNCKTHNEAVHLTDNKINPPIDKNLLKMFLIHHDPKKCDISLENEHTINYENTRKWYKKNHIEK